MKEWFLKNMWSNFAKKLDIEQGAKKEGELRLTQNNLAYFSKEGNTSYKKIPKDVKEGIKPEKEDLKFSPHLEYVTNDGNAHLMAISCITGSYGNSVNVADFVTKIEDGEASISQPFLYSYSNMKPKILDIRKNKIAYDTNEADLFQKEHDSFEKAMEYTCENPESNPYVEYLAELKNKMQKGPEKKEKIENIVVNELEFK